jgi:hypothetical protein
MCSAGENHGGGIKKDGSLWAWGANYQGQLAQNNKVFLSSPVQIIMTNKHWVALSFGNKFSAALENSANYFTPTASPTPSGTEPTSTPSPSPSISPTPTGTESTVTPTVTASPTPSGSVIPTATPLPTGTEATPTPTPS